MNDCLFNYHPPLSVISCRPPTRRTQPCPPPIQSVVSVTTLLPWSNPSSPFAIDPVCQPLPTPQTPIRLPTVHHARPSHTRSHVSHHMTISTYPNGLNRWHTYTCKSAGTQRFAWRSLVDEAYDLWRRSTPISEWPTVRPAANASSMDAMRASTYTDHLLVGRDRLVGLRAAVVRPVVHWEINMLHTSVCTTAACAYNCR